MNTKIKLIILSIVLFLIAGVSFAQSGNRQTNGAFSQVDEMTTLERYARSPVNILAEVDCNLKNELENTDGNTNSSVGETFSIGLMASAVLLAMFAFRRP